MHQHLLNFWSMIIPYTPYTKLQTEQWVIGSDISVSLIPFGILVIFSALYLGFKYSFIEEKYSGAKSMKSFCFYYIQTFKNIVANSSVFHHN